MNAHGGGRRGTRLEPKNRFESTQRIADHEQLADDGEELLAPDPRTEYFIDDTQSIVSQNDSPDVFFRYSINPYRGCAHGCAYCYARPSHEYLGLNAGIDFETKIFVKQRAPQLLRKFLAAPGWRPEFIAISGVTDPYQPCEREYRLTRACVEVLAEAQQGFGIITKNALITRDLDLLGPLAHERLFEASISLTSLRPELIRQLEPRTSTPAARLRAIRELSSAGVPVKVMVAPIIPGLNDEEIPAILQAAREAGARSAGYILLRLPHAVKDVFVEWLQRTQELKADRVEGLIRSVRHGELTNTNFGERMRGSGEIAGQIAQLFRVFKAKLGFEDDLPPLDFSRFRPPRDPSGQLRLF